MSGCIHCGEAFLSLCFEVPIHPQCIAKHIVKLKSESLASDERNYKYIMEIKQLREAAQAVVDSAGNYLVEETHYRHMTKLKAALQEQT